MASQGLNEWKYWECNHTCYTEVTYRCNKHHIKLCFVCAHSTKFRACPFPHCREARIHPNPNVDQDNVTRLHDGTTLSPIFKVIV